ncbi:MAG: RagB/SusD family nutrient uptake outer membrane protein [Leadbetterella sp.]
MKNKIIKYSSIICFSLIGFSCEKDFLDKTPQSNLTLDNFYQNKEQIMGATASLYGRPWFNFHHVNTQLIEAMAGNATHWNTASVVNFQTFNVQANSSDLNLMWGGLYRVIGYSNTIIHSLAKNAGPNVSKTDVNEGMAEAHFMRAVAYFYLVKLWGAVPIVENTEDLVVTDTNIPRNEISSVYEFILRDLKFAEANGRPNRDATGRVSKWSAKALMSKVYLQMKDYPNAKLKAEEVIASGEYSLNTEYLTNFQQLRNNSPESIFALQWNALGQWTDQNTTQAWIAPNDVTELGDGWTFVSPTLDLNSKFENGDRRRKYVVMNDGDTYPELVNKAFPAGYRYNSAGKSSATNLHFRKGVVGASPSNGGKDGFVASMFTGLNTNVIRYADVLLIHAEATLGANPSTSDSRALASFNAVRRRAGLSEKTSLTSDEIFQERRVELAGEYDFWYDLQRMDRSKAINYITAQERGTVTTSRKALAADIDWYLPIPVGESDRAPRLKDTPVPYVFK